MPYYTIEIETKYGVAVFRTPRANPLGHLESLEAAVRDFADWIEKHPTQKASIGYWPAE